MNEKKVREPRSTFELTEIEKNDRGFKNERRLQFDARSTKREVQNVRIYFKKRKRVSRGGARDKSKLSLVKNK